MSWNKIYTDSGFYMDSETGKIKYENNNGDVIEYDYLKREIDRQLIEEIERAKIKEEPKEETVLQFKEISW